MSEANKSLPITTISPVRKWGFPDLAELFRYRDLLYFLVWRTIKVSYAQSVGGLAWAVVQPAIQVLVFSVVFGGLLELDTGDIPYPLFSTVAVIPWTYMVTSMTIGSSSLVGNAGMLGKVYFPRLIYLLVPSVSSLISFGISIILIVGVLLYYRQPMTSQLLLLPFMLLLMMMAPFAVALWASSLTIRFRDFQIMMAQMMRVIIYFVPVMYSSDTIAPEWRSLYILNPFVGVIEGYRSCLLGMPIQWDSLVWSAGISTVLLISGAVYFRRMERVIVDVI